MSLNTTSRTREQHHDLPTDLPPNAGRAAAGIAIVLVAQLMIVLDATVVNVALPQIDADLGFGPASLSWVLNAYTLAFGGLLLLGGRLGDVFGRLKVFEIGLAVFILGSALGGHRPDPRPAGRRPHLPGRRRRARGPERPGPADHERPRRGRPQPGARALRRRLVRWRVDRPDPRRAADRRRLVALDALHQRADRPRRDRCSPRASSPRRRGVSGRFDVVGALAATGGAVALVWTLIGTPEHGWLSARTIVGFVVGARPAGPAGPHRARHPHPLVQPHLVRNRNRVGALAVMALLMGANLSMFFLVVQYVQGVLGFGPLLAGVAFLPFSLGIFATSRVTPALLGRFGARPMMLVGAAALAVAYAWLSTIGIDDTYLGRGLRPDDARRHRVRTDLHAGDRDRARPASSPSTPAPRPACCRPRSSSAAPSAWP